jgi:2,3-bisphosphoglycerate-independent phosphoglycerate mutase
MKTKILCILDGFGIGPDSINNAISRAKMPNLRRVMSDYFWTTLDADGEAVGQEAGLVGNSEVGHMNIGGLQLVPQLSYQITNSAKNSFVITKNEAIQNQLDQIIDPAQLLINNSKSKTIHLIGLFSTGTIHSDLRHWIGAIEAAGKSGMTEIVLHLISDGRDSDKKSLVATWEYFTKTFENRLKAYEDRIFLGSLGGRFYGMDRDNNYERIGLGLTVMLGEVYNDDHEVIFDDCDVSASCNSEYDYDFYEQMDPILKYSHKKIPEILKKVSDFNYSKYIFDENIYPIGFWENTGRWDNFWLINFRSDRMKQITTELCESNKDCKLKFNIIAMNDYGVDFGKVMVTRNKQKVPWIPYTPIFRTQKVQNTLAETISNQDRTQLRIAETEKYAHVTYFLNGGSQNKNSGEHWELIPSNKVNSHAEKPEMKAKEITDYIITDGLGKYDYIIANYANPDMVAHTGLIPESIDSLEFLDEQLGRLIDKVETNGHSLIITADHGNCEFVGEYIRKSFSFSQELNKQVESIQNLTDTEHNPNPVPCIIVDERFRKEELLIKDFLNDLKNISQSHNLKIDLNRLSKIIEQENYDLINQQKWLTQEQIEELKRDQLPLWYVGVLLLAL